MGPQNLPTFSTEKHSKSQTSVTGSSEIHPGIQLPNNGQGSSIKVQPDKPHSISQSTVLSEQFSQRAPPKGPSDVRAKKRATAAGIPPFSSFQ